MTIINDKVKDAKIKDPFDSYNAGVVIHSMYKALEYLNPLAHMQYQKDRKQEEFSENLLKPHSQSGPKNGYDAKPVNGPGDKPSGPLPGKA